MRIATTFTKSCTSTVKTFSKTLLKKTSSLLSTVFLLTKNCFNKKFARNEKYKTLFHVQIKLPFFNFDIKFKQFDSLSDSLNCPVFAVGISV